MCGAWAFPELNEIRSLPSEYHTLLREDTCINKNILFKYFKKKDMYIRTMGGRQWTCAIWLGYLGSLPSRGSPGAGS